MDRNYRLIHEYRVRGYYQVAWFNSTGKVMVDR